MDWPTGKYRVILADPPWAYRVFDAKGGQGRARSHYPTMTLMQMQALPVRSLAAKHSALLMWATMPCLEEAFALMRAWGFEYKTVAFTWVKLTQRNTPCLGLGHYTRGNAELVLLGTRGSPKRQARNVSQIIQSRRREHSRKPIEQYERIMQLFDGPYLELFARHRWPGWEAWGNQVDLFPAEVPLWHMERAS